MLLGSFDHYIRCSGSWSGLAARRASIVSFSFSSGITSSGLVGRPMAIPKYVLARECIQRVSDSEH